MRKPFPLSWLSLLSFGMIVVVTLILSACTSQQSAVVQAACQVDGVVQPIAAAVIVALVPAGASAVAADNVTVHPALQKLCQAEGGLATVVQSAVATPATNPVAATPAAPVTSPLPATPLPQLPIPPAATTPAVVLPPLPTPAK